MSISPTDRSRRIAVTPWFGRAAAAIVLIGFGIRCIGIQHRWLWLDELLSANFSKDGPWTALLTTARFDVHPPLYYLQLSLWMLGGHSDQWLMLNSIIWSAAAIALLYFTASEFYGPRVGLGASAMLAVAPAAFAYSDSVRMYSMLLVLILLAWYTQTRWFSGTAGRLGALWVVVSQCAVAYTHGAGPIILSGCVLLGTATAMMRQDWRLLRRWMAIEVVVGILLIPAIIVAFMREVTHTAIPDFWAILQTWTFLTTGHATLDAGFVAFGVILFGVLVLGAAYDREAGLQTAALVFGPLLLAGMISYMLKPAWLDRTFVPIIPFLCLALARATLEPRGFAGPIARRGTGLLALLLLAWLALGVSDQFVRAKGDGFKPTAALVRQMQHPGDLIVVGSNYSYWCFLWYYAGADWGMPLHAFNLNADWARMLARLPRPLVALFGMSEADRTFHSDGATVMLWDPAHPLPRVSGRVIVVGARKLAAITVPGYRLADSTTEDQLTIEQWVPDASNN